jgi:hypothetical protein
MGIGNGGAKLGPEKVLRRKKTQDSNRRNAVALDCKDCGSNLK